MDRGKVINEYLEVEGSILHDLDNDKLFGAERIEEILREAGVKEMRAKEINIRLDAERKRLEALSDQELEALLAEEEAMLKELRNLGQSKLR